MKCQSNSKKYPDAIPLELANTKARVIKIFSLISSEAMQVTKGNFNKVYPYAQ